MKLFYGVYENSLAINSYEINKGVEGIGGYLNYIKKTVIDKLGEPHNHCDDDTASLNSPLANQIKSRDSEYRQSFC